jgi:hypothetical protein
MEKDKDIEGIDPFGSFEGTIITYELLLCGRKYDQNTYEHYIIGPPNNLLVPNFTAQDYSPKTVSSSARQEMFSHFMCLRHLITYLDYQLSNVYSLYQILSKHKANNLPLSPEFGSVLQYSTQDIVLNMVKFIELFTHEKMKPFTGEITKRYSEKFVEDKKAGTFIRRCANAYKHTWINLSSTMNLFGESMPMVNAVYVPLHNNKQQQVTEKYMASLPAVVIAFRDIYEYLWLDKTSNYKITREPKPGRIEYFRGTDEFFTGK